MSNQFDTWLVTRGVDQPIWDRVFTIAPLVLVGTREETGEYDIVATHSRSRWISLVRRRIR